MTGGLRLGRGAHSVAMARATGTRPAAGCRGPSTQTPKPALQLQPLLEGEPGEGTDRRGHRNESAQ